MNVVAFIISGVLFFGSFVMLGYSFELADPYNTILFLGAMAAASIALAIPFHWMKRLD